MATVLIADDSMFQRFILAKVVEEKGHRVLQARSGQECVDMALENHPDLILLDLNMPGLGGIEALEAFRSKGLRAKAVVITADIQSTTKARCLELGAAEILNKPLDEDALRSLLEHLLPVA